jgi:hypothetical protein
MVAFFLATNVDALAQTALTQAELQRLIPGNELTSTNTVGQRYTINFAADGSLKAQSTSQGSDPTVLYDGGRWTIETSKLCIQYTNWQYGRKICFTIMATPQGYTQTSPTGVVSTITFKNSPR